jgi:hypothetical protein
VSEQNIVEPARRGGKSQAPCEWGRIVSAETGRVGKNPAQWDFFGFFGFFIVFFYLFALKREFLGFFHFWEYF